jgi:hypothetical protein
MHQSRELQRKIQANLPLHGARIGFIVKFVMVLIVVRGVKLSIVASAMNPKVLPESNEKRIKRWEFTRFGGPPAHEVVRPAEHADIAGRTLPGRTSLA